MKLTFPYFVSGSPLAPNVQPPHDFFIPPPTGHPSPFHSSPNFLTTTVPQFAQEINKLASFEMPLRPVMPSPLDQLSMRISPLSNSQSISPQLPTNAQETKIHSTVDQSSSSECSEDEDIDVVKSAFVPIKSASKLLQEIQHPDSTVQDKEPLDKCELKAPNLRTVKNISVSVTSPNTKFTSSPAVNAIKAVWRPY